MLAEQPTSTEQLSLKEELEKSENKNLHLLIMGEIASFPNIVNFKCETGDGFFMVRLPTGPYSAYYLCWKPDAKKYIDIPESPTSDQPKLFITSNLSGCCVGVQRTTSGIRVFHYNLYGTEQDHFPTYPEKELYPGGSQSNPHWLLPADKYDKSPFTTQKPKPIFYSLGDYNAEFWGEYRRAPWWPFGRPSWHFYYQGRGADTTVHEFSY